MGKEDTQFKPGQSGNPGGRPKLPEDIAEARKLNAVELERVINRLTMLNQQELQKVVQDPKTTMFELMMASIIAQAAKRGDQQRLDFILNRSPSIGKVAEKIDLTANVKHELPDRAAALKILTEDYAVLPAVDVEKKG